MKKKYRVKEEAKSGDETPVRMMDIVDDDGIIYMVTKDKRGTHRVRVEDAFAQAGMKIEVTTNYE